MYGNNTVKNNLKTYSNAENQQLFVRGWLELPGVHPLEASHGAVWLVCQRACHTIGERMEQVETKRQQKYGIMKLGFARSLVWKYTGNQTVWQLCKIKKRFTQH